MIEINNSMMISMFSKYNERFASAYDELLNDKDFMSSLGTAKMKMQSKMLYIIQFRIGMRCLFMKKNLN